MQEENLAETSSALTSQSQKLFERGDTLQATNAGVAAGNVVGGGPVLLARKRR